MSVNYACGSAYKLSTSNQTEEVNSFFLNLIGDKNEIALKKDLIKIVHM